MKAFKTFINIFEAPQRSVKLKFKLIFSIRPGMGWEGLITNNGKMVYFESIHVFTHSLYLTFIKLNSNFKQFIEQLYFENYQ